VQRAGRLVRSARRAAPDRRFGAWPSGREPHGTAVYRRLRRRPPLRHAQRFGFARGSYLASADDGLTLVDARITNAGPCEPPDNKPAPAEIRPCRSFLQATIAEMQNLRAIVTLGRISHDSTLAALTHRRAAAPFGHGASHDIGRLRIFVSYHCSRY